jgi:hypothetical protein
MSLSVADDLSCGLCGVIVDHAYCRHVVAAGLSWYLMAKTLELNDWTSKTGTCDIG